MHRQRDILRTVNSSALTGLCQLSKLVMNSMIMIYVVHTDEAVAGWLAGHLTILI